jgi:hypothetical protein
MRTSGHHRRADSWPLWRNWRYSPRCSRTWRHPVSTGPDARDLSKHTKPELDEHDLTHLDVYTASADFWSSTGNCRRSPSPPPRPHR